MSRARAGETTGLKVTSIYADLGAIFDLPCSTESAGHRRVAPFHLHGFSVSPRERANAREGSDDPRAPTFPPPRLGDPVAHSGSSRGPAARHAGGAAGQSG